MGDFNMSLFKVIPELRSGGVDIDLGAWYPWKSLKGEPMTDSCGIFFVNLPGMYTLNMNLCDILDRDQTGVLARAEPVAADDSAVAGQGEDSDESEDDSPKRLPIFDRIEENAGPGMRLGMHLPKDLNLRAKFSASLTPSDDSAAVAATQNDRKVDGIKFKEKRLDARIWRYNGGPSERYPFPDLCLNEQCRPPIASEVGGAQTYTNKQSQRRGPQWWPATQMQRQGSQERPPWRARPQQGSQADADPQQGRQCRTSSGFLAVAEQRPAVADDLENAPDAMGRWGVGRRGERGITCTSGYTSSSHAIGYRWSQAISGQPWGMAGAHELAAVAATGPNGGLKSWWHTEAEEPDIGIPADVFTEVLPTYVRGQVRVQL